MRTLYIIDDSNWRYKYKAVYSKSCSVDINGVSVNTACLFGYLNSIRKLPFSDILVVLDGIPSQSLAILPTYKGTRNKESDEGLSVHKSEIIQFLTQIGPLYGKNVKVVCSPLQETDQVISSVVHYITRNLPKRWEFTSTLNTKPMEDDPILKRLTNDVTTFPLSTGYLDQFDTAVIASTDADFVQLLRFPNVYIDTSISGKEVTDVRSTDSTSYLPPAATVAYKAIFGDVSDNIPPIPTMDKTRVVSLLCEINTDTALQEFLSIVRSPRETFLSPRLLVLAKEINALYLAQFERNLSVAYLKFFSIPIVLTYPSYRIQDTITKYKLRP